MGQGYLDSQPSVLVRESGGKTMKPDCRFACTVPRHFDFPPAHSPRSCQRLHCLVDRLLRRDPGSGMPGGIGPGREIFAFLLGKEARHGLLALTGEQRSHPLEIDEIDPYTDD